MAERVEDSQARPTSDVTRRQPLSGAGDAARVVGSRPEVRASSRIPPRVAPPASPQDLAVLDRREPHPTGPLGAVAPSRATTKPSPVASTAGSAGLARQSRERSTVGPVRVNPPDPAPPKPGTVDAKLATVARAETGDSIAPSRPVIRIGVASKVDDTTAINFTVINRRDHAVTMLIVRCNALDASGAASGQAFDALHNIDAGGTAFGQALFLKQRIAPQSTFACRDEGITE